MIYKLVTNKKVYYGESTGETPEDRIKIPINLKKFRFFLWYKNPQVQVYRYNNYKWQCIFNLPYRELI